MEFKFITSIWYTVYHAIKSADYRYQMDIYPQIIARFRHV